MPAAALTGTEAISAVLLAFCCSLLLSLLLTGLVRSGAHRLGWLDPPDGARKLHERAVPRLGGLSVQLTFLVVFGLTHAFLPATLASPDLLPALHLMFASSAVMLVGLLDDVRGARPATKVAVQVAAAAYLYVNGFQINFIANPLLGEPFVLGWISLPLTIAWFVGISNAFNLIDGLDGLAAGVGLFSTSIVFVFSILNSRWEIALLAAALAGALLGFLRYNFSPASIFLGDCGALTIGFVLAGLSLRGSMKASTALSVLAPLLTLGFPIVDTGMAMLRRLVRGRSILEADADHIHHRLVRRGMTPQRAVMLLYGVTALFGAMALLTASGQPETVGLAVVISTLVTWVGVRQLGYRDLARMRSRIVRRLAPHFTSPPRGLEDVCRRLRGAQELDELWDSLVEAARWLGVESVELRVREDGGVQGRFWQASPSLEAPAAGAAVRRPLACDGLVMGHLALGGAAAGDERLDVLLAEVAAAVGRLQSVERRAAV